MIESLFSLLSDPVLFGIAVGALSLGILMGALPGLSGPMAMALLIGATVGMPVEHAAVAMALIYMGGVYGGSQSAILLNIPGAAASAATSLDGYPLASQGRAGVALASSAAASMVGSLIGVLFLITLTPLLVDVSLLFGTWEFALLALFGVIISGSLASGGQPVKGWVAGILGLILALVGQDPIQAYPRFTFGSIHLLGGIAIIPVLVGLFGLSEVAKTMKTRHLESTPISPKGLAAWPTLRILPRRLPMLGRSGVIGTFIGLIPGVGADIGAWVSYAVTKRLSKHPETFGQGEIDGVLAAEGSNSAVPPGSIIPVLALGIPGSAAAAIMMAALFLHGLRPGPLFLTENAEMFNSLAAAMLLGSVLVLVIGLVISRVLAQALRIPRSVLMPVVLALAVIGAYGSNLRLSDVWIMIVFGVVGYLLRQAGYPLAPMVLGVVLGGLLDGNLRRAFTIDASLWPFVTRPASLVLVSVMLLTVASSIPVVRRAPFRAWRALQRGRRGDGQPDEAARPEDVDRVD